MFTEEGGGCHLSELHIICIAKKHYFKLQNCGLKHEKTAESSVLSELTQAYVKRIGLTWSLFPYILTEHNSGAELLKKSALDPSLA